MASSAIEGIDTRALVRLTRERGAMKGILSTTDLDDASLVAKAKASPGLVGRDLAREVMPAGRVDAGTAGWTPRIAWSRRAGRPVSRPIPRTRRMLAARTSSRSISG